MNKTIHENIVVAVVSAIRQSDAANQCIDWLTVLKKVHGDMLGQSSRVLNGKMFDALINFREYLTFDAWASAWRINQFSGSGRMVKTVPSGSIAFLFNASALNRSVGILEENPAFSTCHGAMLLKYEHYKNDLSGDLNLSPIGVQELSEVTSFFLKRFKISMGSCISERLSRELAGLTVKTFLEYLVYLIEETNFTTPVRPPGAGSPTTGFQKYQTTERLMADIDWPAMFNDETRGLYRPSRTEVPRLKSQLAAVTAENDDLKSQLAAVNGDLKGKDLVLVDPVLVDEVD